MLRREHDDKDYEVIVPLELLRAAETKRIFNIVLGSIAGISLLVGGIGIMNVMLATVTERTREIDPPRPRRQAQAHRHAVPRRDHGPLRRRRTPWASGSAC